MRRTSFASDALTPSILAGSCHSEHAGTARRANAAAINTNVFLISVSLGCGGLEACLDGGPDGADIEPQSLQSVRGVFVHILYGHRNDFRPGRRRTVLDVGVV